MTAAGRAIGRFIPSASGGTLSIGCSACEFMKRCGGLADTSKRFSCFDECNFRCDLNCGNACPKNPHFLNRVGEVGGLELNDIPFVQPAPFLKRHNYIPLLDHRHLFCGELELEAAAVPLRRLFNVRTRTCSYLDGQTLRRAFGLPPHADVLAIGVSKDVPLEHLWGLLKQRRQIVDQLGRLELLGITAPNFSSFRDQPRTDDLTNQKRMLWAAVSLHGARIPTALHWSIFHQQDFVHHVKFLQAHSEYDTLSIEFGSGLRSSRAGSFFVNEVAAAVANIGRPMYLITKGGLPHLSTLARAFKRVTFVDSVPFQMTLRRYRFVLGNNGDLLRVAQPTSGKAALRNLLAENIQLRKAHVYSLLNAD